MSIKLPTRHLVSQNDAAMIQNPQVPRSRFTGSWTRKTAFDAGYLVPFLIDEVLPGDHLKYNATAYVRMSTPLFPIMDNQEVATFFFYVPNRILWAHWVNMMGEQANPTDTISYVVPTVQSPNGGYVVGSVFDHFGLPTIGVLAAGAFSVVTNALPLRAYNKIWNAWFRDQNMQNSVVENTGDNGTDSINDFALMKRAKAHDYFTTALPWAQKFTAPNIPLLGTAPITGLGVATRLAGTVGAGTFYETDQLGHAYAAGNRNPITTNAVDGINIKMVNVGADYYPAIYADLTQATGVAINQLRQAWMVQSLLERDARGGTRYVELIRSHFGVTNPDFRLQRPEYIGGGKSPLNITPVAQTAPTAGAPLGALGAAGTSAGSHSASYAATEHGYIIGLINVRSELSYQQGVHKLWRRASRYDFYWPALAGMGEQAIIRQEIYARGDSNDEAVFGYQERWQEYRSHVSEVTGIMRSTAIGTLDAWHLAQKFVGAPVLGDTFIQDTPPMDRILAAGALAVNQQYLADILIQRTAVRPIPTYGTPVTLGRF